MVGTTKAAKIVASAKAAALLATGKPYKLGGNTMASGFDCSGFVLHVLRDALGEELPKGDKTAAQIAKLPQLSLAVSAAGGDLVFFPAQGGDSDHIGIVLDTLSWIGSQSSTGVKPVPFANPYWMKRKKQFLRFK